MAPGTTKELQQWFLTMKGGMAMCHEFDLSAWLDSQLSGLSFRIFTKSLGCLYHLFAALLGKINETIFNLFFSDDLPEKEIEIKLEISKKAGLLRKPVKFSDVQGRIHEAIERNEDLWMDYIDKNPVHRSIQVAADMSKREVLNHS